MPFGLWGGGGEEEGRGTKNILARENRMKQVLRTSFLAARRHFFPPVGDRFFCTDDRKLKLQLGLANGQPSNKAN